MNLTEVQKRAALELAPLLLESSTELSHSDVHKALSDHLDTLHPGDYTYVRDVYGDGNSGDVVYSHQGKTFKAPYTLGTANGKRTADIDTESKIGVSPRTVYDEQADDDDQYTAMEESFKRDELYSELPLYERFIAKAERDAADESDFAGKGRSFPILKPGDIMAAVRSMGRAGAKNLGPAALKARIIAIAKRKGWTKYLPKAWQTADSSEAGRGAVGDLKLVESSAFTTDLNIREALTPGRAIKLIAPGKGSSAFYTAEVLKKAAADKIFKAGTPMRIDHPTEAEEAARPEGSVKDWGAVLAKDAYWSDTHPQGAGLYSEVKTFSDHAATINEKGPYAGVSIRASGNAVTESGRPVLRDGVPLLKEFTSADGVDMVTRAGAGGMFLTEAARTATNPTEGAEDMTAEEIKKLIEAETKPLRRQLLVAEAQNVATAVLAGLPFGEKAKAKILSRVLAGEIPQKDGALDAPKLVEAVNAEAKDMGVLLSEAAGGGRVFNMGASATEPAVDPKKLKEAKKADKEARREVADVFGELGLSEAGAKRAAKGREVA